jgi:hypothetical protein
MAAVGQTAGQEPVAGVVGAAGEVAWGGLPPRSDMSAAAQAFEATLGPTAPSTPRHHAHQLAGPTLVPTSPRLESKAWCLLRVYPLRRLSPSLSHSVPGTQEHLRTSLMSFLRQRQIPHVIPKTTSELRERFLS